MIVGLGGTGELICRWAEESIRGLLDCVPPFIRFLKLDTDLPESGCAVAATQTDFYNLLLDMDVGEVVRDWEQYPQQHEHLDWLKGFRMDSAFSDYGCQGIPRLGRLVFAERREMIHRLVAARFSDLRTSTQRQLTGSDLGQFEVSGDGSPAVHLVGSVCGGTGAGMLVDMAYNLRWWSRESFDRAAEIIGHLVLPEAFNVDIKLTGKLKAVAAATLEQIEYLMDSRRENLRVSYRSADEKELCFDHLTAPFNFLYLLNGHGDSGSGNRTFLVKLIARVIRAMTIEPCAQHVTSDANNKLNEILGLMDPACGRKQCFASYGFAYATPEDHGADVNAWIYSALEMLGAGPQPGYTSFTQEVAEATSNILDIDKMVATARLVDPPSQPFTFVLPPPGPAGIPPAAVMSKHVWETIGKYLQDTLVPHARSAAKRSVAPGKDDAAAPDGDARGALSAGVRSKFLNAVDAMIRDSLYKRGEPLSQVVVCLDQWEDQLDRTAKQIAETRLLDPRAVLKKLREEAEKKLNAIPGGAAAFAPIAVIGAVAPTLRDYLPDLAQALMYDDLLRSMRAAVHVIRRRRDVIESLVNVVAKGRMDALVTTTSEPGEADHDLFSTAFKMAPDPNESASKSERLDFRQKLIRPLLNDLVLSDRAIEPNADDVDRIRGTLIDLVQKLDPEKTKYLKDARKNRDRAFHRPAPTGTEVPKHDHNAAVCDVLDMSKAKIRLSRKGVYAEPLDVGIAQQMPGTCIPDLLTHHIGPTFREANVAEAFEKHTGAWFQLIQFRYGFCLEAVGTTDSYVKAIKDYVLRRGLWPADLWLDRRWYTDYKKRRAQWKRGKDGARKAIDFDYEAYEEVAARIGLSRRLAQDVLGTVERAVDRMTDVAKAVRTARDHRDVAGRIERMLDELAPEDADGVGGGLVRCFKELAGFLKELEERANGMTPADQENIREALADSEGDMRELGMVVDALSGQPDAKTEIRKVANLLGRALDIIGKAILKELRHSSLLGKVAELHAGAEAKVEENMSRIDTSDPEGAIEYLTQCFKDVWAVLKELYDLLREAPDTERKAMREVINRVGEDILRQARTLGISLDEGDLGGQAAEAG